ncbi:hypothetical protein PENTCL1PPCAC_23981, partial [Pristionchus entomophagus]
LVAQELFHLQISQSVEINHNNWPPHRVLIRRVLAEQLENERRADRRERRRRRKEQGREAEDSFDEAEEQAV